MELLRRDGCRHNALSSEEKEGLRSWNDGKKCKEIRQAVAGDKPSEVADAFISAVRAAPHFKGIAYRGMSDDDGSLKSAMLKAGVGGEFSDKAPMSTTREPDVAKYFTGDIPENSIILHVTMKTGRSLDGKSEAPSEKGIIGMPGVKYKIEGIHENSTVLTEWGSKKIGMVVHLREV